MNTYQNKETKTQRDVVVDTYGARRRHVVGWKCGGYTNRIFIMQIGWIQDLRMLLVVCLCG